MGWRKDKRRSQAQETLWELRPMVAGSESFA